MVDDFLRKAKDFISGAKDGERERDYDERQVRGRGVRPSREDSYGDSADEEYYGNAPHSREDRHDDEDDEEDSSRDRPSRRNRYDDEDDDE